MDEEDEFGDLYTDVLSTFPSSSAAAAAAPPLDPLQSNPVNDDEDSSPNSNKFGNPEPPPPEIEQDQEDDIELDVGSVIPGLHGPATINNNSESSSDSDSDDGLQIVLNETEPLSNHHNHNHNHNPNVGSFDDDDVDDLQIVADDPSAPNDDPDWGDDKDPTDPSKPPPPPNPNAPPRPNYPPPYNSFHSQFKYVRPGVAQGTAPVQARPPLNVALMSGRGRGDFKGPPINKPSFHPSGFWGPAAPPRGFDFTLPSHKSVLPNHYS